MMSFGHIGLNSAVNLKKWFLEGFELGKGLPLFKSGKNLIIKIYENNE